jgi:predicted secreted protein
MKGPKPSWLQTAQSIYPLSDEEYCKMFDAARRSAKIELNRCNAFTPPNYQRQYIHNSAQSKVIEAAILLRDCKKVTEAQKCSNNLCEGCNGPEVKYTFPVSIELSECQVIALKEDSGVINDGMKSQVIQQVFDQINKVFIVSSSS